MKRSIVLFSRGLILKLGLLSLLPATEPVAADGEVRELSRGPAAAWVETVEWEMPTTAAARGVPGEVVLSDSQARMTGDVSEFFFRTVTRLLNREGVQQNAEVSVTFSPEYQKVTWHTLRLRRGEETIDLLPTTKFRRLQRELGLEGKVYDGRITAMAVLENVRVGDVLESAYTLTDANPLTRGHQSFRMYLGAGYPVRRQAVVARLPATLPKPVWYFFIPPDTTGLSDKIFGASNLRYALRDVSTADEHFFRWEATDLPAIQFDGGMTGESAPYYPTIRCSSFATWSKVVDWALPLFNSVGELAPEQRALVATWRKLATPEERLRAAVDWVQGELRYFSMAFDQHNVKPRPLVEIATTRFGDCKDKTVLLVALLRELGFEAWPALVNTYSDHLVRHGGPDQYAFNHAIVAYEFGGKLRWIDPTLQQPAGQSGEWNVPPYSPALILRDGEIRLTDVSGAVLAQPDMETVDRIHVDAATGEGDLETAIVIRGLQADFYRQRMEQVSAEERSKGWFNYLARFYQRLEEVEAPELLDDRAANTVTVKARYRLPGLLRNVEGVRGIEVHAYALRTLLDAPESRRRHWPLALPFGRSLRHRIEVELPFSGGVSSRPHVVETAELNYRAEKSVVGTRFVAVHDLRFPERYVRPEAMPVFADSVTEVLHELSTALYEPPSSAAASDAAKDLKAP